LVYRPKRRPIKKEVAEKLHLQFAFLPDADLAPQKALDLPTFEAGRMVSQHGLMLIIQDGLVAAIMHAINEPAANARDVLAYLSIN
jgi:peroxiredoxin